MDGVGSLSDVALTAYTSFVRLGLKNLATVQNNMEVCRSANTPFFQIVFSKQKLCWSNIKDVTSPLWIQIWTSRLPSISTPLLLWRPFPRVPGAPRSPGFGFEGSGDTWNVGSAPDQTDPWDKPQGVWKAQESGSKWTPYLKMMIRLPDNRWSFFVLHNFQDQGTLKSAVLEDFLTDMKDLGGFIRPGVDQKLTLRFN